MGVLAIGGGGAAAGDGGIAACGAGEAAVADGAPGLDAGAAAAVAAAVAAAAGAAADGAGVDGAPFVAAAPIWTEAVDAGGALGAGAVVLTLGSALAGASAFWSVLPLFGAEGVRAGGAGSGISGLLTLSAYWACRLSAINWSAIFWRSAAVVWVLGA